MYMSGIKLNQIQKNNYSIPALFAIYICWAIHVEREIRLK